MGHDNSRSRPRVAQSRLTAATALATIMLYYGPHCHAEELPPAPSSAVVAPDTKCTTACPPPCKPGAYRMEPLFALPGQTYTFDGTQQAGQGVNGGGMQPFNRQAAVSPEAAGQRAFAPNMIGDFFGGATKSTSTVLVPFHQTAISSIYESPVLLDMPLGETNFVVLPDGGTFRGIPLVTTSVAVGDVFTLANVQAFTTATYQIPGPGDPPLLIANGTATVQYAGFDPPDINGFYGEALLDYDELQSRVINIPSPSAGGVVGRMKIAENTSPLPRDRVFFNYSYFDGVPLTAGGVDVNRVTPGFEKTFFNGRSSFELRTPFASTLSNTIFTDGVTNTDSTQFGNMTMYLKQLLYTSDTVAVSGGLGIALPTASDVHVRTVAGQELVNIKNESVHLLPFLGSLYTPTDRMFVQQFLQFDFDANGNPVSVTDFGGGRVNAGRANDTAFLYYSLSAGYWMYNNPDSDRLIKRIAPIMELHYNKSLQNTDVVSANGFQIGNFNDSTELLNGTVGLTAMMGDNKSLTAAYVTPLGGGDDRQFNGELRVMFNWYFGSSSNRFSRVQF